jgi:TolB-like protein/DNA-binding winged helix-turn-helix (wHTH) protein/Tfp pilus assembly protein PilF
MKRLSSQVNRRQFGNFELDLETGELRRAGIKLRLQDKPFQLLALLLEHPGEIVTREAVRDRLWPADTFVDFDHSLNTAVRKLRQLLGESAETPRFIETVSRRGYRFIAPVMPGAVEAAPAVPTPPDVPAALVPPPVESDRRQPQPAVFARRLGIGVVALALMLTVAWMASLARRPASEAAASTSTALMRVAVLPFKVLTSQESEAPLGIGLADAVITQLANIRNLHVLPTAAVIKYGAGTTDPRRAGQELDAAHVLVGTLHKGEDRYRISVQLLRTSDGVAVWARNYDVAHADLLAVQDRVSEQVAEELRMELTLSERARRRVPRNPAAYEPYLKARGLLPNYTEVRMRAAIEQFEHALQLDPDYALARAGLATALAWFSVRYAYESDALEWGRRADEQANRALALDPGLAEAHLAIASAAGTMHGRFNWQRLLAEADEALKIEPSLDLAFTVRARGFYHLGLFEAAHAAAAQALALNPAASVEVNRLLVALALFSGHFEEARARAEALMKQSDAPVIKLYLGAALFYLGERQRAAELLAGVMRGNLPDVRSQAMLASVLAALGQTAAAQSVTDQIIRGPYMDHHVAYSLGAAFAQLGRKGEAVTWLRTAIDEGFPCYPWFMQDPMLEPIREDEDYRNLMRDLQGRFETARSRYGARGQ